MSCHVRFQPIIQSFSADYQLLPPHNKAQSWVCYMGRPYETKAVDAQTGAVAEWSECSPHSLKGPGGGRGREDNSMVPCSKPSLRLRFKRTLSVHPAVNGYLTLFRSGELEGSQEKGWRPTSVTPLLVRIGPLPLPHFPTWPLAIWEQPFTST